MVYTFKKHEIELFDSIQDLPILRLQKFNKYQMMQIEIGNTMEDFDTRSQKIIDFLRSGMLEEAIQELENRRQMVFYALNEFTPMGRALAVLVKRIDDVDYFVQGEPLTTESLERCLNHLEKIGLTSREAFDQLLVAKKKIDKELETYFPKFFQKSEDLNKNVLRAKKCETILDEIIHGKNFEKEVKELERGILEFEKPNNWNVNIKSKENMERALEVDFVKFAVAVSEHSTIDIQKISTFQFYSTVEHLQEKFTSKEKK